jgi:hypothetical protein
MARIVRTHYRYKRTPADRQGAATTALRVAAVAAALAIGVSGCTSITAYEASPPYYRFPIRGGGGGGGNGG